jgi:endoglucanase
MHKSVLYILVSVFLFFSCTSSKVDNVKENKTDATFKIYRGTNIAHWLSQSARRGAERAAFFTATDIHQIDSMGFDHIRLPVDEEQLWDSTGKRQAEAFLLLDSCLYWCREKGLKVILDLHILRSHHFNAKEKPLWTKPAEQDKFIALWRDLASAVNKFPEAMLAYEFMNEPVADDAEQWNVLLSRVTDSIRSWEKNRTLVIGSNRWQSANTFDQLRIPAGDKNILLSFHFYEPFFLSHYKASWTDLKDFKGTVQYPGQIVAGGSTAKEKMIFNRDTLVHMMRKPIHLADSLGLLLYCGEFGIIDGSPRASALAWYKDMISIFDQHKIAYANWNYKAGSFGIVDKNRVGDTTLINILLARP